MAQLIITIPDDKVNYILDGLAIRFKYADQISNPDHNLSYISNPAFDPSIGEDPSTNPLLIEGPDFNDIEFIDNPESKAIFARGHVINFIKYEVAQGYRIEAAGPIVDIVNNITLS